MFGRGRSKEDLVVENAKLQVQVELLQKQNGELISQVTILQQALVAKESPKAYEDQMIDRGIARDYRKVDNRAAKEQEIVNRYMADLERARLFDSADDMNDLLSVFVTTGTDNPVHDVNES